MPTQAQLQEAFKPYTDEMERCLKECHWALFHLVMVIPDICGALRAPNGRSSGKRYRDWCRDYLPPMPLTPAKRHQIRCLLLHQGRSTGALKDGTPVVYGVASPGQWPHGAKDGAHTILDVGVLHAELRNGLTRWSKELEAGKDAAASYVDRNLPSLVMVRPARVPAPVAAGFGAMLVPIINVTK